MHSQWACWICCVRMLQQDSWDHPGRNIIALVDGGWTRVATVAIDDASSDAALGLDSQL